MKNNDPILSTIEAIILSYTVLPGDKMVIHCLSREYGKIDCIIYGTRSKKTGHSIAFIYPFSIVEITANFKTKYELIKAKKVDIVNCNMSIPFDPIKASIASFLGEFLYKALHEGDDTPNIYYFCRKNIEFLEQSKKSVSNFHIKILIELSGLLGIYPQTLPNNKRNLGLIYDLINGQYIDEIPVHNHYISATQSVYMNKLLRINNRNYNLYTFSRSQRKEVIERIIAYYRLHIPSFGEIKTLKTMCEIFD